MSNSRSADSFYGPFIHSFTLLSTSYKPSLYIFTEKNHHHCYSLMHQIQFFSQSKTYSFKFQKKVISYKSLLRSCCQSLQIKQEPFHFDLLVPQLLSKLKPAIFYLAMFGVPPQTCSSMVEFCLNPHTSVNLYSRCLLLFNKLNIIYYHKHNCFICCFCL